MNNKLTKFKMYDLYTFLKSIIKIENKYSRFQFNQLTTITLSKRKKIILIR